MRSVPRRLYRLAKAQLDILRERIDEIDSHALPGERAAAERELTGGPLPPPSSAPRPVRPAPSPAPPPAASPAPAAATPLPGETRPAPLVDDWRLLGLPDGTDFAVVRDRYLRQRARCDPSRFPEGSEEEAQARQIQGRLDAAFERLREALCPTDRRFDRLEF